jgi:hypothetical protein
MNEKYINDLMLNLMAKDDSLNEETRQLITSVLKSNSDNNAKIALIETIIGSN